MDYQQLYIPRTEYRHRNPLVVHYKLAEAQAVALALELVELDYKQAVAALVILARH